MPHEDPPAGPQNLFHSETAPVCATPQDTRRIECQKSNNNDDKVVGHWTTLHAALFKAFSPKDYFKSRMKNSLFFFKSRQHVFKIQDGKFPQIYELKILFMEKKGDYFLEKKKFKRFEKAQHWSWTSSCRFDKS